MRAAGVTRGAARVLLTGGTGFLGSHLAAALLARGESVTLLARPPAARVSGLLDWLGVSEADRARLRVVEGDVTRPALGIDPAVRDDLLATTGEVIHCASSTSFAERRRAEVEAVNLGGLARVLEFASASRAAAFHHVSTAYVAGRACGVCPERLAEGRDFHNVYEETKCRGERLAEEACRASGIALSIHRPSIVCGDSRTGRSLIFNGIYYPVRTAVFLRDLYREDILEHGGRRAAQMGVRLEADGATFLPVCVDAGEEDGIDLIPVDYFIDALLALRAGARGGEIFHIVRGEPTRIAELVDFTRRFFGLSGLRVRAGGAADEVARNPLETLFDRCLEAYTPYLHDARAFATDRAGPILRAREIACPAFDYECFGRCMSYAVATGWGARRGTGGASGTLPPTPGITSS